MSDNFKCGLCGSEVPTGQWHSCGPVPSERSGAAECSQGQPLRTAYSRAEITDLLTEWMLCVYGSPAQLSEAERSAWFERNGMVAHFLRDQFPENDQAQQRDSV